jgi:hypothetical protein
MGHASMPGVHRDELHVCWYCGERVCEQCSTSFDDLGRACDAHDERELLDALDALARLEKGPRAG